METLSSLGQFLQGTTGQSLLKLGEVRAATQPLSLGLVQDVTSQVSGTLAERGLSQAPGIQATELATALAPYQQQNQQTALQLVLTRLGLPLEYAKTILA